MTLSIADGGNGPNGEDPNPLSGADDLGGDGDEALSIAEIAAQVDAQLLGTSADDSDDASGSPGADGRGAGKGEPISPAVPAVSDPFREFADRYYQGNLDAARDAYYHSTAEAVRLAEENAALKAALGTKGSTPAGSEEELKAAAAADPDIVDLDQSIKTIVTRHTEIRTEQVNLATTLNKIEKDINDQVRAIDSEDDPRKVETGRQNLINLTAQLTRLQTKFEANADRLDRLADNHKNTVREHRKALRDLGDRIASEKLDEQEREAGSQRTQQYFDASMQSYLNQYGVAPNTDRARYMTSVIRGQLREQLLEMGPQARSLDALTLHKSVGDLVTAYAKMNDMRPRKSPAAGGVPPVRPAAPRRILPTPHSSTPALNPSSPGSRTRPRTPDELLDTPDGVRARAEGITNAMARAAGRRQR